ncbi:binding-protein-dependent transport systems inner membrane component [Caldicellulosiruptor saccharolyticus DSM 8903]|uniref:Binding-protein-dependent transport systems inner membrane component n=1 Tax=Caldicellulosiruptor saccharolyticus (strain ATCC 43494 / DSM 8903 / Tp8T 6331) TaxID=351627 RepID=A4XHC8_CALS8|nr:carbohydrate ABC transporter permease [Caldicellulosiruptor saccharolyticus]ABP66313.1 binding-protein-dependent transport systems inner membrane component [Caldicellulosiruptor saccharolyticus DSM 8903]
MNSLKETKKWYFIFLAVWTLIADVPFLFMLFTSFKTQSELLSGNTWQIPKQPTVGNFSTVLEGNFFTYLKNSIIAVSISVVLILIISSMAAFAFSRFKFAFNNVLYSLIIAGMAIPIHVTLIPIYVLTNKIRLYDTVFALIGPYVALSLPMSIFILTEFMREIPIELEEAAKIDGCSMFRLYSDILLPLSTPALITVGIYNGTYLWNEFVFALVLTSSPTKRTLPLGIWDFQAKYGSDIPAIMAFLTLSLLPMLIAYVLGQDKIIKGMMAGAVKG